MHEIESVLKVVCFTGSNPLMFDVITGQASLTSDVRGVLGDVIVNEVTLVVNQGGHHDLIVVQLLQQVVWGNSAKQCVNEAIYQLFTQL